jgi:ubiquinone/menaquinone biosynthesis C-methylase UbiE
MTDTKSKDPVEIKHHVCPWWLAYTFDNPLRRLVHDPRKILGAYFKDGARALDVGCGMGYFSIATAKLAGPGGSVVSVDLQQKMLDVLMSRAKRAGVADRITPVKCNEDGFQIDGTFDFALAFWVVHELLNRRGFFATVRAALKKGGRLLVVEPRGHVTPEQFDMIMSEAREAGFEIIERPAVFLSRAMVLSKGEDYDGANQRPV